MPLAQSKSLGIILTPLTFTLRCHCPMRITHSSLLSQFLTVFPTTLFVLSLPLGGNTNFLFRTCWCCRCTQFTHLSGTSNHLTTKQLCTMTNTKPTLLRLFPTSFQTAPFPLLCCPMSNTHPTLLGKVCTRYERASKAWSLYLWCHLCSMFDAHSSIDNLVGAPFKVAINGFFFSMSLTESSTSSLIGACFDGTYLSRPLRFCHFGCRRYIIDIV
mmetsp:Transcript_9970/g.16478  ORF Transcript_9970/g.16478 Transcript_9970/m.16478 type:complete len:215 (-) Transcript_9970:1129-1773(-)